MTALARPHERENVEWLPRPSFPRNGWRIISPIPIFASSRCATSTTTRPITRGTFRARCGSIGNRRAGTKRDRQFVTPAAMAQLFGGMGIGPQSTVVLYGDPVQFGSYAFWTFTMAGHANLRLLDGGRRKWVIEGRPLSHDGAALSAGRLSGADGNAIDAGRPPQCARQSAKPAAAAARRAFAGGIQRRARDPTIPSAGRSRRATHRAHPRRGASLLQGTAQRGRFVQVAGRASPRCLRRPASRRKSSTTSSAIAG